MNGHSISTSPVRHAWLALLLLLVSLSLFGYSLHLRRQDWAAAQTATPATVAQVVAASSHWSL